MNDILFTLPTPTSQLLSWVVLFICFLSLVLKRCLTTMMPLRTKSPSLDPTHPLPTPRPSQHLEYPFSRQVQEMAPPLPRSRQVRSG